MKLNKCFTTVFDAPLKERGFKKKGLLYYRMNGEILQGITVKLTNPYDISFAYLPYWLFGTDMETRGYPLGKNYWAEGQDLNGSYYKADDEETELKKMQGMMDIFLELVIPFLDGVYDLETYISVIHSEKPIITDSFVTEEEKQKYGNYYKHVSMYKVLDQYAMLLKAFRDGSFRTSEKMVSDFVRREHRRSLLHGPYLSIETLINWYFKDFYKCYSNNDLNWIVPVYEEKCAEMKQKLLDELKLTIE